MKNIFLGLTNTAGVCTRLKTGFEGINIKVDFYSFGNHAYGYKTHKIISYSKFSLLRKIQKIMLIAKLIIKYDYFIYVTPSPLLKNYKDVELIKKFGKKSMIIFTGCDVRMPEKVEKYEWNPCRECPDEYKSFVGCVIDKKKKYIGKIEEVFDIIVCPQEASGFLKRSYTKAYFPVNLETFPSALYKNNPFNKKLRILHAPSNPAYKGSKFIFAAVEVLKKNFDFEFKVVSNISLDKLYKEIEDSDLIIDQMLTGSYGLFAIESMAMFKPVVCYIRDEIWNSIKHDCPIYNANADNLYEVLEGILKNPSQLNKRGSLSRSYVEKYHDAAKIARQYYQLFENLE